MTEWEVFGVIVALIGFVVAIGTPILKLNTSITKLIARISALDGNIDEPVSYTHLRAHET